MNVHRDRPPVLTEEVIDALSLEEAEAMRVDLIDRVMAIDVQLASRSGERVSRNPAERDAYWEWRKRAVVSKNTYQRAISRLGARMRALRAEAASTLARGGRLTRAMRIEGYFTEAYARMELNPDDPLHVLRALYSMTDFIVKEGAWEASDDEKAVLAAAQRLVEVAR